MKKREQRVLFGLVYILISSIFFLFPMIGKAEVGDISVKAILPENQHNPDVTYYDLRVTPGQTQEVKLEINNAGDKEENVTIALTDARTSRIGDIDYSVVENYKKDSSLSTGLTDIAKVESTATVPAKGSITVPIQIKVPQEPFDGMILGGVTVTQPEGQTSKSSKSKGMQIENRVSITVGMKLTESDTPVEAALDFVGAKAGQEAGRNQVEVTLQNHEPTVLEKIDYEAKLYKKGENEVLHERKVSGYRFAPNSSFTFPISWEGERFEQGTYRVKLTAVSQETGQKWQWDEEFEITAEEAKKLNDKAVDLEEKPMWYYYLLIGIGVLVVLVVILLILRNRKKKKEEEEKRARAKAKKKKAQQKRKQERKK